MPSPTKNKRQIATIASPGILHELPADLASVLLQNAELLTIWNNLTPIQRNE
jgi:hypothetical protein